MIARGCSEMRSILCYAFFSFLFFFSLLICLVLVLPSGGYLVGKGNEEQRRCHLRGSSFPFGGQRVHAAQQLVALACP